MNIKCLIGGCFIALLISFLPASAARGQDILDTYGPAIRGAVAASGDSGDSQSPEVRTGTWILDSTMIQHSYGQPGDWPSLVEFILRLTSGQLIPSPNSAAAWFQETFEVAFYNDRYMELLFINDPESR